MEMTSKQIIPSKYYNPNRSYVFMDISINDIYVGRITFELFDDIVPDTVENFRTLCSGEKNSKDDIKLHYRGSKFYRIVPGKIVEGGDITRNDGRGGRSIWYTEFPDENFEIKHFKAGLLSMANNGPDTNTSKFFITLDNTFWYDYKHVVFGQMIEGKNVLEKLENIGTENGRPLKTAIIENCGVLSESVKKDLII